MGSKVGVHSERARREKKPAFVSAFGEAWRPAVVCPRDGLVAEPHPEGVKFCCPDLRCPFSLGWVIRPTSEVEDVVVLEQRDDGDGHIINQHVNRESQRMVAVPLDQSTNELSDLAEPWPRKKEASKDAS